MARAQDPHIRAEVLALWENYPDRLTRSELRALQKVANDADEEDSTRNRARNLLERTSAH